MVTYEIIRVYKKDKKKCEMKKRFGFLSHLDLNLYLFRTPIMKELLSRGHEVFAITPKGEKNQALKDIGCKVINYEISRQGLNPFKEKLAIESIYQAIKDLELDVLHTFTAKPNIYGTFAAKKAAIPIVLNLVEGLGSFYTTNSFKNILIRNIMQRLYKKAFSLSNGSVFVNSDDPKFMIERGIIKEEKVKIIKSVGVDTDKFNRDNFTTSHNKKTRVLMVARAIWDKGIKEYYQAASLLNEKYGNLEFLLVGDTDEGNSTCATEEFLQSGCVTWLGHRDDIAELTASCDIYVLPSYREGLPVTLLEAASMSKPIVTTDTVGCRDVVEDGYNGFLVPIKDADSLAQKIEQLILDENLREQMGKRGRERVLKEFDVKMVVKQYMDYYERFLK